VQSEPGVAKGIRLPLEVAMKGLVVRSPWVELILDGAKTWELRGSPTRLRGRIALIRSGSGTVVGHCEIADVVGPLTRAQLLSSTRRHCVKAGHIPSVLGRYRKVYAWVLSKARRLKKPVRYRHPSGAVIWVNLNPGRRR
jgi:hypothetical protein